MSCKRLIISQQPDDKSTGVEVYEKENLCEVYADGVHGIMINNGMVKFNLFSVAYPDEAQPKIERREIGTRVVCGVESFVSMVEFLNTVVADIKGKNNPE